MPKATKRTSASSVRVSSKRTSLALTRAYFSWSLRLTSDCTSMLMKIDVCRLPRVAWSARTAHGCAGACLTTVGSSTGSMIWPT
jgi:hypothetical protein